MTGIRYPKRHNGSVTQILNLQPTEGKVLNTLAEYLYSKPESDDEGFGGKGNFSYKQCQTMNVAFARALLKARKDGHETGFSLGPIPPPKTDFYPTHFDRPPRFSGAGSSAADYVERGIAETVPNRYARVKR